MMVAFVANTNVLELRGLQAAIDQTYVNDATVTVTIKDDCGSNVAGQTWPAAMNHVEGSNGDYRVIISSAVQINSGKKYFAEISATGGASEIGFSDQGLLGLQAPAGVAPAANQHPGGEHAQGAHQPKQAVANQAL